MGINMWHKKIFEHGSVGSTEGINIGVCIYIYIYIGSKHMHGSMARLEDLYTNTWQYEHA